MVKIALIGAAGQIGTPLSLLCKASDLFDEISLYDLVHVPGIATDLMHIDTRAQVNGYLAENSGLKNALAGADIIVVTAVNSTVPIAAETLKKAGVFDPARLFGVTTLDVIRASTFAAHALGGNASPKDFKVPVVGGHSGATILPLYSQAEPPVNLSREVLDGVINRVQFGGDEIVKSKQGAGSATTCMAYAGFRFIQAVLKAKNGEPVTEEAYVYLPGISGGDQIAASLGVDYFAVKVELGKAGAVKALPIGEVSENEAKLLAVALNDLKNNIAASLTFMST